MKRRVLAAIAVIAAILLLGSGVWAAQYRAAYTIIEANGNTYTMLPVSVLSANTWMAANGFMQANALDTRVETLAGAPVPHMVAGDRTLAATALPADSEANLYFTTDNADLVSMPIITGYNGYVRIFDVAALELGNNFEIEIDGYILPPAPGGTGEYLVKKGAAFEVAAAGSPAERIIARILSPITPTGWSDPGVNWNNEANAIDNNTATFADYSAAIGDGVATGVILFTHAGVSTSSIGYWIGANVAGNLSIDIDAFYGGAWNDVYQGTTARDQWVYKALQWSATWTVTSVRIAITNNTGGAAIPYIYEVDYVESTREVIVNGGLAGEQVVTVSADAVNLTLSASVWGVASVALAGASVADTADNWIILDGSITPYTDYYQHTVGGALIAWYQPITIISGATLPDREGGGGFEDGTIFWGTNPAGVTVTLGVMQDVTQPVPGTSLETASQSVLPETEVSDWFQAPAVSGALLTNPLRPLVTMVSDNTTLTEMQTWRLYGFLFVIAATVLAARMIPNHLLIAGAAMCVAIIAMVGWTIWPIWALVFALGGLIGGVMAERMSSV